MKRLISIDTLDIKSVLKASATLDKILYNINFKQVAKIKLLDLNVSGSNMFRKHGINTIGDASKLTNKDIDNLKGVGAKAIASLQNAMFQQGVAYKIETKPKDKTQAKLKSTTKNKAKTK